MIRLLSRLLPILAIAGLGLAFGVHGIQRASAHASYSSSNPSDEQVLATAPSQVTISFVSDIVPSPGTFATVTCNGKDAATGPGQPSPSDSMTLVVPLMSNLPSPAQCLVFWKSTDADDGGVTFGRFSFFIGNVSAADVAGAQAGASVAVPDDAKDMALTNVAMGSPATSTTTSTMTGSTPSSSSATTAPTTTASTASTAATTVAEQGPAAPNCAPSDSMCAYCQNHPGADLCPPSRQ